MKPAKIRKVREHGVQPMYPLGNKKAFIFIMSLSIFRLPLLLLLTSTMLLGWNTPTLGAPAKPQISGEQNARKIYQQALPAVVTILLGNGHGSGFIVNKDGLIVTNAHVTEDGPKVVTVKFADGSTAPADVLGFSKNRQDLSLVKISGRRNLPFLPLASLGAARVGDRVYAIGSPLEVANANTFTQGDVIRIDRTTNYIIHTALINRGNSGGPLVNSRGQLVGVNTRGYFEKPLPVLSAEGQVIGEVAPESGQQGAVNIAQVREFLSDYRRGELSARPTYRDPSPSQVATAPNRQPKVLATDGRKMKGELATGDSQLNDGSYVDAYTFEATAGQQITVDLVSKDFNSLLLLYATDQEGQPTEKPIAQNDDTGPGNLNSRINNFTLPNTGTYVVYANSNARGETGKYQISATLQ
jgi:serine protease Do